jgi:hypothetical protein
MKIRNQSGPLVRQMNEITLLNTTETRALPHAQPSKASSDDEDQRDSFTFETTSIATSKVYPMSPVIRKATPMPRDMIASLGAKSDGPLLQRIHIKQKDAEVVLEDRNDVADEDKILSTFTKQLEIVSEDDSVSQLDTGVQHLTKSSKRNHTAVHPPNRTLARKGTPLPQDLIAKNKSGPLMNRMHAGRMARPGDD